VTAPAARPTAHPQHGPAIGITRRLLGRFHVTGVFWYRFHYWGVAHLPIWMQRICIACFTPFFFVCLSRIRGAVASNLDPVLGPASRWTRWRRAYRTLHEFAECLTERYRRIAAPEQVRLDVEGESFWREATAGGRGAVLVTAHIGPWEVAAHLGAEHEHRLVHVVREGEIDPRAQAFVREVMSRAGAHCITHFAGEDPRLALELSEALRRGELVALQGDRPRAGGRTAAATLFGQPMPLPIGPIALARAAGVPLLPIFNFRTGPRTLRAVIRPPIPVDRTANREADLRAAVGRLARDVEWAIRERPHQWFCFRKLWD
jgi:lauroyl/myristoyl acyltransferase